MAKWFMPMVACNADGMAQYREYAINDDFFKILGDSVKSHKIECVGALDSG